MSFLVCGFCRLLWLPRACVLNQLSARLRGPRRVRKQLSGFHWLSSARRSTPTATMKSIVEPTIVTISPVLRLHKYKEDANTPLVLLMPWATATERALDRFRTLYAQQGFNVLTAYALHPKFFLWPPTSAPVVAEISNYLITKTDASPIVVHALSIGAYVYSLLLARVIEHDQEFKELQPRIYGQVFDSMVLGTRKEQRTSLSDVITKSWILQKLMSNTFSLYFFLTHSYTLSQYERLHDIFWNNPFKTSVYCIYSSQDPMCKTESMEEFIDLWKVRTGNLPHFKQFDGSHHAECLRNFPEEYEDCLVKYLNTLNLDKVTSMSNL
ncbi:transmembrane protein 53-like isoform X1 [Asterias rubens]|uniref:transmembrane protein 53-like isoform X1 n=2 Tax=Asterias rubens TaxID=7604 RepID=UPI0014554E1E|nr:transmembrane protein 53-like isoform X1 [Asterias rubens]